MHYISVINKSMCAHHLRRCEFSSSLNCLSNWKFQLFFMHSTFWVGIFGLTPDISDEWYTCSLDVTWAFRRILYSWEFFIWHDTMSCCVIKGKVVANRSKLNFLHELTVYLNWGSLLEQRRRADHWIKMGSKSTWQVFSKLYCNCQLLTGNWWARMA